MFPSGFLLVLQSRNVIRRHHFPMPFHSTGIIHISVNLDSQTFFCLRKNGLLVNLKADSAGGPDRSFF